jgi:hypothetical protein
MVVTDISIFSMLDIMSLQIPDGSMNFISMILNISTQIPAQEKNYSFGKIRNHMLPLEIIREEPWEKSGSCENPLNTKNALQFMINIINMGRTVDSGTNYQQQNLTLNASDDLKKIIHRHIEQVNPIITRHVYDMNVEKLLTDVINKAKQPMASEVIFYSNRISFVVICIQSVKLYLIWREISKAKNLHEGVAEIRHSINSFEESSNRLIQAMQAEDVQGLYVIINAIITQYNKTNSSIKDRRTKTNESVQRLKVYRCTQLFDAA